MLGERKILEVHDLRIVYRTDLSTVYAVNGVTFSMNKGETLGLVGETGAGKTTLALSILRLLPDRTGRVLRGDISFEGHSILTLPDQELRAVRGDKISMIFQDPMTALNPTQTVGKQLFEALSLHNSTGMKKAELEKRVDTCLEMVGIPAFRKKDYPHQFSGGMRQRVVIAIALCCEPDLLIADEPTTALDVTIQAQVLAMMKDLKERLGTSLLMITHDLGIVAQTCDTVAVMYAGKIIEYGRIEDIFDGDKHHPYTVGLFGSIPNLEIEMERLSPIDGLMPDPTDLPDGCSFAPRCPYATEKCRKYMPANYQEGTHTIRCFRYTDEVDETPVKVEVPRK
ncbi:MAG: ABC transporter ATP-binding protein [Oscillibacter sp.]|jgi:peptide/nickel transport system ATP-binding protein|nr:ABC transporter ATP-binding protein [Oscillibacter sp.]